LRNQCFNPYSKYSDIKTTTQQRIQFVALDSTPESSNRWSEGVKMDREKVNGSGMIQLQAAGEDESNKGVRGYYI
jgi:hypothetical protein